MATDLSYGVRRIIDSRMRFVRDAKPVYLRLRSFATTTNQQWSQLGFQITPATGDAGTVDILIDPPPSASMVSMHNLGQSNGKLRFGARTIRISHTFVLQSMALRGITDPELVWSAPDVVGLVIDGTLFSIEIYEHKEYGGGTALWDVTINGPQVKEAL